MQLIRSLKIIFKRFTKRILEKKSDKTRRFFKMYRIFF